LEKSKNAVFAVKMAFGGISENRGIQKRKSSGKIAFLCCTIYMETFK